MYVVMHGADTLTRRVDVDTKDRYVDTKDRYVDMKDRYVDMKSRYIDTKGRHVGLPLHMLFLYAFCMGGPMCPPALYMLCYYLEFLLEML